MCYFTKFQENFPLNMFELADISERSYWGSAILGRCGSGISKDDRGWAEEIPPACVWSGFYDPQMWKLCLPSMVGEKVSTNGSLLLSSSVIAINHFIAIHKMCTGKSLWSLRALALYLAAHKWLRLCKIIWRPYLRHRSESCHARSNASISSPCAPRCVSWCSPPK